MNVKSLCGHFETNSLAKSLLYVINNEDTFVFCCKKIYEHIENQNISVEIIDY